MALLSRTSIRDRTIVSMLVVAGCALLLSAAASFAFIVRNSLGSARLELRSLGQVLAYNAAPMVAFEDPESALKLLEALRQRPDITRAVVFRANGSALAAYDAEPGRRPLPDPAQGPEGVVRTGATLRAFTPVLTEGGHRAGRLYLESNLLTFRQQIRWAAMALLLAVPLLGGAVHLLALRLQRGITDPVLELAGLASTVSGTQDYTLRARVRGISELDFLAQAFNTMLARIQSQDRILAEQLGQLAKELQERKQVEAALRESEKHFRSLYENTTDVMYWVGTRATGEFWVEGINPATEALIRKRDREVAGRILAPAAPREVVSDLMLGKLSECRARRRPVSYEETLPGDRAIHFHINLVPLLDDDGQVYRIFGTARDITELRTAEAAFRQAQKLESLGLLAGGIAHDFNNLLTAVLGNLALADAQLAGDSAARPYLGKLEKTVLRAAELTRQMLAYAGRGRFQVECIDLNRAVREIGHLLAVSIAKTVDLSYRLADPVPCIAADVAQIQQVVMNLVTNASDAIGSAQGRIAMTTAVAELDAAALAEGFPGQAMEPGRYVLLEVCDSGCGMSPATLQRIFDPFFTTKPQGRGLGLSAMVGILRGHRAGLQIHSREGEGSSFRLFFPACEEGRKPSAPAAAAAGPARLEGRILLVDDEAELREAMAEGLAAAGLEVVQARDGQEALEQFRLDPEGFRLVVMDLTMPRMDGKSAFHEMEQINPRIPVILCTGYDPGESAAFFETHKVASFLQKPFKLAQLIQTMRQVLGP